MQEFYKTTNSNGELSCGDIGITAEEWLDLLHRPEAAPYIDALVCFLREPAQKGTCSVVGLKYGKPAQHYNSKLTSFSEWVQKTLARFRVVDADGNPTYWCIAMQAGQETTHGFVWQLRKELTEALRIYLMEKLIGKYKTLESFNGYDEQYKWELLANTKDKSPVEIAKHITGKGINITDNARVNVVLNSLAENEPGAFTDCINHLYDETKPLDERLAEFKSSMANLCTNRWKNCANDEQTASAFLFCKYPEAYTVYQEKIYQLLCDYFGYESQKAGKKLSHFIQIINEFVEKHGDTIQNAMLKGIGKFEVKPQNLAVQTLFWCMQKYMSKEMEEAKKNYWLVGFTFGDTDSQLDRFFEEGVWDSWYNDNKDEKQLKLAQCIKRGDFIILKSTSTKGKNHDQPFLRVKGVGIVEDNIETSKSGTKTNCRCNVKYISKDDVDFDGPTYGSYRKTVHQTDTKVQAIVDYVNKLLGAADGKPKQRYKEYIELLKETHNLVLTGAPGTGKTYMAQEIAKEMGAVTEFVQFHPSYDYTDFVEGLRPIEKADGQMGFERKDGVFKEFCKKAIRNLVDADKSIESLAKELSWEEKLQQFIDDATENNTLFKLSNGNEFTIEEIRERTIVVHNKQNEKTTRVSVNADEIIELLTEETPLNIVRDIRNHFGRRYGTQPDSYAYIITKEIRKMKGTSSVPSADKIERKDFVFIIDEINRGEASKIFGELFYAIDPGYRGKKDVRVKTQYQNLIPETDAFASGFYVPKNVYILATMNDIDRSVESMDFAMRRRFTWKEVTPAETESMLDSLTCASEAKAAMNRLNTAISETDGLGVAYQVGPSYFLKLKENDDNFGKLWKMNIEPLLREYLRGFRKASEILDKFNEAYFADETSDNSDLLQS